MRMKTKRAIIGLGSKLGPVNLNGGYSFGKKFSKRRLWIQLLSKHLLKRARLIVPFCIKSFYVKCITYFTKITKLQNVMNKL
jgi:hypothetical protein